MIGWPGKKRAYAFERFTNPRTYTLSPRRWQPPSNCWNVFGNTVTLMPLSQPTAATRRILTRPRFSRLARPWSKVQACSRLVAGKDLTSSANSSAQPKVSIVARSQ